MRSVAPSGRRCGACWMRQWAATLQACFTTKVRDGWAAGCFQNVARQQQAPLLHLRSAAARLLLPDCCLARVPACCHRRRHRCCAQGSNSCFLSDCPQPPGLHDIAAVLLFVLDSELAAYRTLRALASTHLRDCTRPDLGAATETLSLLYPILEQVLLPLRVLTASRAGSACKRQCTAHKLRSGAVPSHIPNRSCLPPPSLALSLQCDPELYRYLQELQEPALEVPYFALRWGLEGQVLRWVWGAKCSCVHVLRAQRSRANHSEHVCASLSSILSFLSSMH